MTTYETSGQESSGTDDVEPCTCRAVTEYISILEDGPGVDGADATSEQLSELREYDLAVRSEDGKPVPWDAIDDADEPDSICQHVVPPLEGLRGGKTPDQGARQAYVLVPCRVGV
jgi:hypothetical protein